VLGVDGSAGMLAQAATKPWPSWVRFEQGRAEALEEVCADAGFQPLDGVFAAYLLRNVPDRDRLVEEVSRVLRPGGALVIHEYWSRTSGGGGRLTAVCRGVVVPLGWLTSRRTRLYHYLWRSVMDMDRSRRSCGGWSMRGSRTCGPGRSAAGRTDHPHAHGAAPHDALRRSRDHGSPVATACGPARRQRRRTRPG
jgi:SAM-dependent methyltransferase